MEHFIRVYDSVLSADLCREAIRVFKQDRNKFRGRGGFGDQSQVDTTRKVTTELVISSAAGWRAIESELMRHYVEYVNRYSQELWSVSALRGQLSSEPFRIKKYDVDGFFDWHIDCTGGENIYRVLAVQFYFNDVRAGGETEFAFQDVSVKPVQGRLVIFPTTWTYRHRGAKVISNPKYVCTNFVKCTPPP